MKKILLVDDEEDFLDIFGQILIRFGYEVLMASSGQDAVIIAKDQQPDLIILDIKMPVMDGIKTTDILKNYKTTREIPIIYLSSLVKPEQVNQGHVEGSVIGNLHFLSKSCSPQDLLEEVERSIGSPTDHTSKETADS